MANRPLSVARRRASAILLFSAPLLLLLPSAAVWQEKAVRVELPSADASAFLSADYPRDELRFDFVLRYQAGGVLFDCVGRARPAEGDWRIALRSDGRLEWRIFAPTVRSKVRQADGWHSLAGSTALLPGQEYWISLVLSEGDGGILVNGAVETRERLPLQLSGAPLFAGDFPGDDQLEEYRAEALHPAALATLDIVYFGPFASNFSEADYARSAIRRDLQGTMIHAEPAAPLVTTAQDLAETVRPGAALDGDEGTKRATPGPLAKPLPKAQVKPAAAHASPEEALRAFLEAQVRGDVPAMLGNAWLEDVSAEQQSAAQAIFQRVAVKLSFSGLKVEVLAKSLGQQGALTILRVRHSLLVKGAESSSESFGSLALLRRGQAGWRLVEMAPDPLLNAVLTDGAALQSRLGLRYSAAFALPPGPAQLRQQGGLVDYYTVNEKFQQTLNTVHFDEAKIWYDAHFSAAGWIPVIGDSISAAYTGFDMANTVFTEMIPEYMNGDMELFDLSLRQVGCGAMQIALEAGPGIDSAADAVGVALEQHKYAVVQSRNYDRLRSALLFSNLSPYKKYLFLREPALSADPQDGLSNLKIDYYLDWPGERRPVKKITILSDIPLRKWKTMDFDLGFLMTIKSSENEPLFNAAQALGCRVRTLGTPVKHDYEALIPLRLPTVGPRRVVVGGELDAAVLMTEPQREAAADVTYTGRPILDKPRLTGASGDWRERFLRFDITPASGPNQLLSVRLLIAKDALTEPLEIEDAVYNDVTAPAQVKDKLLLDPVAEYVLGVGQTLPLDFRGRTRKYPPPRIVGLPASVWRMEDGSIAGVKQLGEFPEARLELSGLRAGLTRLEYDLYAGDGKSAWPLTGFFSIRVVPGGWMLKDVLVEKVPVVAADKEDPRFTGLEGSRYGASGWGVLHPDAEMACRVHAAATWTQPPDFIAEGETEWKCRVNIEAQGQGHAPLEGLCLDAAARSISWSMGGQETGDDGFGAGVSGSQTLRLGTEATLEKEFTVLPASLLSQTAGTGSEGRIEMRVSTPGGVVKVAYVYSRWSAH